MRGPLPNPHGRVRSSSQSAYSTNVLPAAGRKGPIPKPPAWVDLGDRGQEWWKLAWRTPQAVKWTKADHPLIARRAAMEDRFYDLDPETIPATLLKAMLDIEDRLGLSPKALAQLRWVISDDPDVRQHPGPSGEVILLTG